MDEGWWHIWDDPRLTVYEKAVAQAVWRRQYRGNPVLLARKVIMELASVSLTQMRSGPKSARAEEQRYIGFGKHRRSA